jgi:hypothetical protein
LIGTFEIFSFILGFIETNNEEDDETDPEYVACDNEIGGLAKNIIS